VERHGIGDSATSVHAKTFSVDRADLRRLVQPRSPFGSAQHRDGVIIASPALAERLSAQFDTVIPGDAYEVRLTADGRSLDWIERDQSEIHHLTGPQTGMMRRLWINFLSMLPIEWLL
jgi:putative cardiolipin synthase